MFFAVLRVLPILLPTLISGSKWRTLRTSWKPGSALALPTVPAISTCACALTHTDAHADGQHSHALCLWPLRQIRAHLHRVALGLLQGLVLLALPGGHSTVCSSIQSIGRTLQSILPHATLKGTSLGTLRSIVQGCQVCRLTIYPSFRFPEGLFPPLPQD